MIEETGIVTKADGVTARVAVQKRGTCEGCAAAGVCESSGDGMEIEALNPVNAQVGQTVKVSIRPQTYLKGTLVVYGFPLVAFIAGIVLGRYVGERYLTGVNPDILSLILGFAALVISFFAVKAWSRRVETRAEYRPVIEEIIGNTSQPGQTGE